MKKQMKKQTEKQIELLKKYGVTNYTIDDSRHITINGYLYLGSLQSCDKDFLKGTTINGYLDLGSLQSCDKELLKSNVKQLTVGYNAEKGYCFFDGILSKVNSVAKKKGYVIYTTSFGFIAQRGEFTAHGTTVKKSILDLEFKVISEKLKNEPIKKDTEFTVRYYRLLTGACDSGVRSWMQANDIPFKIVNEETVEDKPVMAVDLLPILEKTKSYGIDKVKSLIDFV